MAYKVFQNGFPLNASELNNYLMNQSVMVFATATARDTDLTAPLEGMIVWLQDSNKFVYYTGSAWADVIPSTGSGNAIINGAFDIWQRGTSFTTSVYTADRFSAYVADGTVTNSRQTFTPGTAPVAGYESAYHFRSAVSGQTLSSAASFLSQKIEDVRTFAGQTVTISFWAKAASGTPKIGLEYTQGFGTGGSPSSLTNTNFGSPTISTSWARYTTTVAIPSLSGKTLGTNNDGYLEFGFWFSAGSNFNTRSGSIGIQNNTIDIWGVQLEAGSTATAFKRNASNIQGELAACQRYFQRFSANSSNLYTGFGSGHANSSTTISIFVPLRTTMRTTPSFSTSGSFQALSGGSTSTTTPTLAADQNGTDSIVLNCTVSGFTAGQGTFLRALNDATANLSMSAEL